MENNNTGNNMGTNTIETPKKKKGGALIIIIILILLAVAALIYVKMKTPVSYPTQQTQSDKDLNQAIESDTTTSINSNIDSINVDDTTDADLKGVDQDLNNL